MTLEFGDDNDTMFSSPMIRKSACIDGRPRVYHRENERFADCCVAQRYCFAGGNVMVWERIAYGRQTPLNVIHGNTVH